MPYRRNWGWRSRYAWRSRYGGPYRRRSRQSRRSWTWRSYPPLSVVEDAEPATKRIVSDPIAETRLTRAYGTTTRSSVVKLSYNIQWAFSTGTNAQALRFEISDVPGFSDYKSVYSEFRILRGELYIPTQAQSNVEDSQANYLVVSSQPFALTTTPIEDAGTPSNWVPEPAEAALRQARWQRIVYPDSTTTGVRVGFQPYTMVATEGPSSTTVRYQRIWRGMNWTPLTWSDPANGISYFGPYVWRQLTGNDSNPAFIAHSTLVLYCQFKGQK